MAAQPRIGLSGGERTSGSAEEVLAGTRRIVGRWTIWRRTTTTTIVVVTALAVLLGITDVTAIRSGEYPRTHARLPSPVIEEVDFRYNKKATYSFFEKCLSANYFRPNLSHALLLASTKLTPIAENINVVQIRKYGRRDYCIPSRFSL